MMQSLIRPLFDGPIDLVGDVHGEIDALTELLRHLGYDERGSHPEMRRLVFLGDLTDRGPDSPAVVRLVRSFVEAGLAQCVLGNHDLNILLELRKYDNPWYFGEEFRTAEGYVVPQVQADDLTRETVASFFRTLPLALERDGVHVVHAHWHQESIELARAANCSVALHEHYRCTIGEALSGSDMDDIDHRLQHQNRNPVKLLTSGPERRASLPTVVGDKARHEERVDWWKEYSTPELCIFGHYSLPSTVKREGRALCVDFGVGKRSLERLSKTSSPTASLAALRLPEMQFVFDDGAKVCPGDVPSPFR